MASRGAPAVHGAAPGGSDGSSMPKAHAALLRDSRINVAESSDHRLVIHLPPGVERTRSLGGLALVWNAALALVMAPWLLVWGPAIGFPLWVSILFLCVAWGIGLNLVYDWLRDRYSQTFLLLERERLDIKRTFLRW